MKSVIRLSLPLAILTFSSAVLAETAPLALGDSEAAPKISMYGFFKTSAISAGGALGSFNDINSSAPNYAAAQTRGQDKKENLSFQAAQSRIGTKIVKGEKWEGQFEFDFIDFSKASPTTQMNPRVRIAMVRYKDGKNKFAFGQDWDLFAPTMGHTYNFVGNYFQAGNVGFMRQQAQYFRTEGTWEFAGALGMAGNNPTASQGDLETSNAPTYSVRALNNFAKDSRFGASAIYTRVRHLATGYRSDESYGLNAFFERVWGDWQFKSEVNYGQNLNNIGSLGISQGTSGKVLREFGGYATAQYSFTPENAVQFGAGFSKIDNRNNIQNFTQTAGAVSRLGIAGNRLAKVGWIHKLDKELSFVAELTNYNTETKVAGNFKTQNVQSLEAGMLLNF